MTLLQGPIVCLSLPFPSFHSHMPAAPCSAPQSASFSLLNDDSLNFLEGAPHKARVTMRKHVIDAVMVCACCKGGEGGGGAYDTIS